MKWTDSKGKHYAFESYGKIEIRARDYAQLRRRINEQEAAHKALLREPPAPRLRTRYHAFIGPDGTIKGVAVIRPQLRKGWKIEVGERLDLKYEIIGGQL